MRFETGFEEGEIWNSPLEIRSIGKALLPGRPPEARQLPSWRLLGSGIPVPWTDFGPESCEGCRINPQASLVLESGDYFSSHLWRPTLRLSGETEISGCGELRTGVGR